MEKVIEWLQGQPDGAEVRWYTDHASKEHPYASSWCDILVPELCDDDGGDNWVWCLGPPWDDDAGGFDIPWEPDLLSLRAHGKNEHGNWFDEAVIPIRFRSITDADMAPLHDIVARFPNATWYGAPAWSTGWMSQGIEAWIEAYAGKRLKAVWDADHGPSRFAEMLKAQVDR